MDLPSNSYIHAICCHSQTQSVTQVSSHSGQKLFSPWLSGQQYHTVRPKDDSKNRISHCSRSCMSQTVQILCWNPGRCSHSALKCLWQECTQKISHIGVNPQFPDKCSPLKMDAWLLYYLESMTVYFCLVLCVTEVHVNKYMYKLDIWQEMSCLNQKPAVQVNAQSVRVVSVSVPIFASRVRHENRNNSSLPTHRLYLGRQPVCIIDCLNMFG